MNKKLLSFAFILFAVISKAQLIVTPGGGAGGVASAIGGAGLSISNVTINCNASAYGGFSNGASSGMGISNGLALTTGDLTDLPGTGNSNDDFNFCVGTTFSDPQLTALSSSATKDVCIIEFDVVPQCTNMGITFVFGSDEYTNWVNQTFNDAFGFFVSGPNPGGGSYTNMNIATIPGGTNVSVDNVNNVTNTAYFVNNNSGTFANHFDGFTTVLSPSIAVTPCATYHIKLAIADASDCAMDSGVLIDIIQCNNVTTLSTSTTPATACGLNNGTASVTVTNGLAPLTYTWSPTPGGGQGTPNATGLTAGTTYTITVDDAYACIPAVSATATIGGPVAPTVTSTSSTVCAGQPATLTATPGTGGGTYSWSPGGATTSSITVSPSSTTTYTVSYTVSGCTGTNTGTVTVNPQPTITPVSPLCSGVPAFNLNVDVAGGTWSGTGITNASAGTFTPGSATTGVNVITYTAAGGCNDTIQIVVNPGPDPSWMSATICENGGAIDLNAQITGTAGGTWSGSGVSGNMFDPTGLSGPIAVTYSVGSSCVSVLTQNITVISNSDPAWTTTSVCQISSPVNLDSLVTGTSGGTWSGTGVTGSTFNPSGLSGNISVTYTVGSGSCLTTSTQNITVIPLSDASWTTTSMCADAGAINLDSTVTGTSGGTWSGTGVTGSTFDPTGLSGPVSVTYTVGPVGCQASSAQNITVTPVGNAAWTTTSLCAGSAPINLDSLVTGTSGGTWSGTGVTGSTFDPAGLSGNIAVTYIVGTAPCQDTLVQNIAVISSPSAAWTTTSLCASATPINLDSLVTGTTGGTWSGTGVTGSSFDPAGLSGGIAVTYTVGPTGCNATSTQNITVTPSANPAWTTTSMCSSATPINLNTLVTGTSGGTWSGTGVTGSTFNPTGLSGPIAVTYTVGTSPCTSTSTQNITVTPVANSAWTTTAVCANAAAVNLNSLVTGTAGGTWSGTGVTGSTFNPAGLSGSISVTYTVGTSPCTSTTTHTITVTPNADATITSVSPMCQTVSPFTLSAASSGGTWSGTGITNPSTGLFSPAAATPGTYTISYGIAGACGDTGTVSITVLPTPSAAWSMPSTICESAAPVDLSTLVTGAAGGTFSGTGVSGNIFDPSGVSGSSTITYTVTQSGCSATSTEVVAVDPITADFTATPVTGMAPLSVTTLNGSTNAVSYVWNFGNGATSTLTNPSTVYTGMGNYTIVLIATNASGCMDTASLGIHVDEISALVAPNVFTPNGDGHNDTFHPIVAEGLTEFKATVYDRWGLKMHEWSDGTMGWDGKAKNGKPAPDGTYFWIISGKGVDGKAYEFTGFVQLFN